MHLRITQKLAKKIKEPVKLPALEAHTEPLADWTANLFIHDRTHYIICSNTATLYSCLFFGAGITDHSLFIKSALQRIRDIMEDDGLEEAYLQRIVPHTGGICFGKALNRRVTSSITEQIYLAKILLEDPKLALYQVAEKLNKNILSYLDSKKPRDAFLEICGSKAEPLPDQLPPNVLKFEKPSPGLTGRSRDEKLWQKFAKTFDLTERMVKGDRLPDDFYPEHAVQLFDETLSTYERSVLSFLLHVWNRYEYPFELSEVVGWSEQNLRAFGKWVTGQTLREPCKYF